MLIPAQSTIRTEDFPKEEQAWIPKLLLPLNNFLTSVTTALNGNITLTDNIPCQLIQMQFTYGASTDFPKVQKWNLAVKPTEVRVCSASENGSAIAIVPAWSYSAGIITFSYFTKLTVSGFAALTVGAQYNIILRGQP